MSLLDRNFGIKTLRKVPIYRNQYRPIVNVFFIYPGATF